MVDFKNGIYSKVFKYTDNNNVEQELILKPLKGDNLKNVFSVLSKLKIVTNQDGTMNEAGVLEMLSGESGKLIHELGVETLMLSYPTANREDIELFVSSHFMELFPVIVELNTPRK